MVLIFFLRGEWFIVLVALFAMAGIPLLIGGIVWYTLRKNKLNRAAWNQLSSEIKFTMPNPRHLEMLGNYNGIDTRLAVGIRTHGSGEDRHTEHFTFCRSRFPDPLRFAIQISSPKGFASNLYKTSTTTLGHAGFDKQYNSICYDTGVFRRLLRSEFPSRKTTNLMGDLMLANESYETINLSDESVYVETSGHIRDHDELKHLLLITNRLAKRFAEAREQFPLEKWERQLTANWSSFALDNGLNMDESLILGGSYRGFPLRAHIHSAPGKWKSSIDLRFPKSLMTGLKIYRESLLTNAIKLFGFQDIKAGHKAFDDAFVVKAKNVQVAKAKMSQKFCDQMIGLNRNCSAIELNDEGLKITVDQVLGDAKLLKSYIEAMVGAMRELN